MTDTSGSVDEKAIAAEKPKKLGFFARRKQDTKPDVEGSQDTVVEEKPAEPEIKPVSFFQLFRFSTKFEIFIDILGIIAAGGAGAAMTLMTLIFGNLTQDFVNFVTASDLAAGGGPDAQATLDQARGEFLSASAKDATYMVYFGVGVFATTYFYMTVWVYTAEANAKRIRERYLRAVLRQDIPYFDKVGAGEIATRIQTDTHLVQQGMSEKVALVVNFLAAFVTGFVLAYVRCWRLALALTSILPCIGITGALFNHFISKYTQASLKHVADAGTIAEEVISTIRTTKAFGSQSILAGLYDKHIRLTYLVDTSASIWHGMAIAIFMFVLYAAYALAFSFGTTLILEGHANAGQVVNVVMAILIGSFSLALLAPEMQALTNGCGAAAKLFQTIDHVPAIDSADTSGEKPDTVRGEIIFENVEFNYPSRPNVPILKNLSVSFPAGKTAALVGASGSGKSTIVSLVERFYDPLSGVVTFDGRDIKTLNLKWLRSQIGLVSQEPTLFATTIKENVAHGLIGTQYENVDDEKKSVLIKEACIKANADGFISKLPNGYETMVGERGFLLSGGQKQRVAIARAIVSDPRILLLDEATSALDTQSEGVVQDALDKAAAGRTTITIAHRLSTIKDANIIYVMGDGQVLEKGTHSELLADENGPYSRLVQAQRLRESTESSAVDEPEGTGDSETALDEIPLARKSTSQSLASELMEQRRKTESKKTDSDYSMLYLFKRMGAINSDQWTRYFFGAIFACLCGLTYPAYGIIFSKAINTFSETGHQLRVDGDRNALWFFIIAIVSAAGMAFQNYLFASSASALTSKLRSRTFKAILRQDVQFFDKTENTTGSLTSALSENATKIQGLAGITLGALVNSSATYFGGIILGMIFAWKIGLVNLAVSPLLLSVGYIRLRVVVLKDQSNKKAHEESAQIACEAAGAIRTVASLTREEDCCRLYSLSLEEPLRKSNRTAIWSNCLYAMSQAITYFVIGLVFWYGSRLVSQGEYSSFQFFIGLMSSVLGTSQAGNVFSFVPDISSAQGAASDTIKLLDSVPEIDADSPEGKKVDPSQVKGHIRFDNIHFRYPTRPGVRVLRGLSIQADPGTYIALVGASGCGKSTVIQLVERFYDPIAGQVYLDDEPISELNVQEYRQALALVSQEPTLYAGTIRFNILLGAVKPESEVTQKEIEEACRNANILDFINSLPDGFETEVGGKGSQLSGGQKQRIAIARALLRNPKVLLLDEATSALDSNSEKVVQEALDQAAKGRTTIAIAHRLSTIQNADKIYFIKDGRVSECGTHDQLLARRGEYYEFVQLQALSKR